MTTTKNNKTFAGKGSACYACAINNIAVAIQNRGGRRSVWKNAVTQYALEMLQDDIIPALENGELFPVDLLNKSELESFILNGAENWHNYSFCGCSLIYTDDLKERLCTNSEKNRANAEMLLDAQARACFQAFNALFNAIQNTENATHYITALI